MDTLIDFTKLPLSVGGMANATYHSNKEFDGRSFLCAVLKYGGEAQSWMDKGYSLFGGNSATTTGSEFDEIVTKLLEGKNFADVVVVAPEEVLGSNGTRNTKAFREWAAQQTGIICTPETHWKYTKMVNSMYGNDAVYGLMTQTVRTQMSYFFEAYGHKLKVRPDAETASLWWDLKTTSATWDRVYRSVLDYGYAHQEWLYVEGAKAFGFEHFRMPFVFVQTMPPFSCHAYYLPEALVAEAGKQLISVMEEVRLRRSTGMYKPAEAGEIQELEVPAWALKQEEVVEL